MHRPGSWQLIEGHSGGAGEYNPITGNGILSLSRFDETHGGSSVELYFFVDSSSYRKRLRIVADSIGHSI